MRRIMKASPESESGVEVTEQSVRVSGSRNNLLYVDESGVWIAGPISILAETQNIRVSTGFTLARPYDLMIPSTAVSPSPAIIPDSPVAGFASFAEEVARLLAQSV
jgi:hypothetical protein